MTAKLVIYMTSVLASLGFCTDAAVNNTRAQELSIRNELTTQPNNGSNSSVGPRVGAIDSGSVVTVPKAQASPGWPPPELQGGRNPLWSIPVESLTATRERPIFSPSRRAPPSVAQAAPQTQLTRQTEPNRPLLTLVGTVAEGREGIAVFRDESTKNIVRMRTGESHLGWTLSTVGRREVTMARNHDTATLVIPNPPAK
jgi:hypothetical protein